MECIQGRDPEAEVQEWIKLWQKYAAELNVKYIEMLNQQIEELKEKLENADAKGSSTRSMENSKYQPCNACTFDKPEEIMPLAELEYNDSTPLLVALWTVYGAIMQAHKVDPYNEQVTSLYAICKEAMEHAKQIPPDETETGC